MAGEPAPRVGQVVVEQVDDVGIVEEAQDAGIVLLTRDVQGQRGPTRARDIPTEKAGELRLARVASAIAPERRLRQVERAAVGDQVLIAFAGVGFGLDQ